MNTITLEDLKQMRLQGFKPRGAIMLSLVGHAIPTNNLTIKLSGNPSQYDFTPLHHLRVYLVTTDTYYDQVTDFLLALVREDLNELSVWNVQRGHWLDIIWLGEIKVREREAPPEAIMETELLYRRFQNEQRN